MTGEQLDRAARELAAEILKRPNASAALIKVALIEHGRRERERCAASFGYGTWLRLVRQAIRALPDTEG
jgi:hypothetical protein